MGSQGCPAPSSTWEGVATTDNSLGQAREGPGPLSVEAAGRDQLYRPPLVTLGSELRRPDVEE